MYDRTVNKLNEYRVKNVDRIFSGTSTMDGAGVKLNRIFGGQISAKITDPFLLLDNFGSENPEEYLAGFPWHPHRGIETVTYMIQGKAYHEDSEGNRGVIYPNDLQWMTAGSGIFHQEMPKPINMNHPEESVRVVGNPNSLKGFQLWTIWKTKNLQISVASGLILQRNNGSRLCSPLFVSPQEALMGD